MATSTISLSQIEQDLSKHALVKQVVIVEHGTTLKTFVTLSSAAGSANGFSNAPRSDDKAESRQVKLWQSVFDKGMYATIKNQPEAIGRDFTGWVCQYNGKALDKGEMNEWLDNTIAQILASHGVDHSIDVLELGTGSGMILFNLTKNLRSYHGLDPSPNAINFVAATARTIPELDGKLHLYAGTALDLHLLQSATPTLAIINSVAQYFPSLSYFQKVLQGLIELKSTRTIFIGDVRSFALEQEFSVSRALDKLGEKASKAEVQKEITKPHSELLVDPAFFTSLIDRFPDQIKQVEILPKHMKASNELVQYRYAAVIHLKDETEAATPIPANSPSWIDFSQTGLDREKLLSQLKASTEDVVAVSNIPYSKTIFERHVLDALATSSPTPSEENPEWLASAREQSESTPSLSAFDLDLIAAEAGFHVQTSCARQFSQRGGLDAIFSRRERVRARFEFPSEHAGRAFETLANQPLGNKKVATASVDPCKELRETLETQLASLGVENRHVVVLEKFPVNGDGEVDRLALARM